MPTLRALIVSFILGLFATCAAAQTSGAGRMKYNFNADWRVLAGNPAGAHEVGFDDSSWKQVTTPYAWNEDEAFKLHIGRISTGVAWYRKHFKLPPGSAGKKIVLEFEGIRFAGDFWLNGKSIGIHENGAMAFGLDITDFVNADGAENVLAAKIDSSWDYRERATNTPYQWNDRNFNVPYGGINKSVNLHVMDKLYQTLPLFSNLGTTGVYVYAKDFDLPGKAATVTAESQVRNETSQPRTFTYEVVVQDADGRTVKTFSASQPTTLAPGATATVSASSRLDGLNFWSWGYGYLYDVTTTLKVDGAAADVVRTRTGFRKTEFSNGAMKLNDRVLHLKGYAQRTTNEWPALGVDIPPWMSDFSNKLMVESNGNLVRWMHVTASKQDVESCDRVGLLQALPAGDAEADTTGRRWENRVALMRDATIYHRNSPSVIFYESGNEAISEAHMGEMKAIRDQFDPHGGRAAGSREMLDSKVAEWGGEMLYTNKSAGKVFWMTEYSRDEALRKYWDEFTPPNHKNGEGPLYNNQDASAYNRNQDTQAMENVARWYEFWRERPGTGKRVNGGAVNIIFSDSNTHARGAENYRRSGEVDSMRIPKDGYFAHKVMWNGWVDVEQHAAHIVGHWNYAPGTRKPVYVISSAEKVELFINGQSKGFGEQSDRFGYTFRDVEFQPGTIKAVGYDSAGKKLCEAEKKTAGDAVAIRLTPRTGPNGLIADGSDVALVDVEVIDANGNRCPTALNMIDFTLTGPAEWRGGIAQGPDNYILAKSLPVECGVNRVIIRSAKQAGAISLAASSSGLKTATITLDSKPFTSTSGWSTAMRDSGLKGNLDRGPTPPGDSVTPTRTPISIVRATAGANANRAANSFDDNELTGWQNDGNRATAWIRYEFDQPATVSEITFKVSNFRNVSYPIRVYVDGQMVFNGPTQRSLGYMTLAIKPTLGKTLRVELVGAATEGDAFGQIIEVTGQKELAAPTTNPSGTLNITEMEIYAPLAAAVK